jgi:PAT family beta-lactamase induction signal transducer AmpG
MGFSSGIPLALTGATLQAWMKNEKVDLTVIGLFSLVGMPYALKFLWSPLMDRYIPPFLGRRRGWILICQLLLVVSIAILGFSNPQGAPGLTATLAFLVAFFSSSQDIVCDAYKTDLLPKDEVGPGAAFNMLGYRVAMLVSGALALVLADHVSWQLVYLIMAATMLLGVVATLVSPEPAIHVQAPRTLRDAVVLPLVEFFKRTGSIFFASSFFTSSTR